MDRRQFIKTMGLGIVGLAVLSLVKREKLPALPAETIKDEEVSDEIIMEAADYLDEAPVPTPQTLTIDTDKWPTQYTWYTPAYPTATTDSITLYTTTTGGSSNG